MIVHDDQHGFTVDCRWQDSTRMFLVEACWLGVPFGRREFEMAQDTLDHAAALAGVSRLSSMWLWRLLEQQIRPHLADPVPALVDVTHTPA